MCEPEEYGRHVRAQFGPDTFLRLINGAIALSRSFHNGGGTVPPTVIPVVTKPGRRAHEGGSK